MTWVCGQQGCLTARISHFSVKFKLRKFFKEHGEEEA